MMDRRDGPAPTTRGAATIIAIAAGLLALVLRAYFVTHAQVLQALDDPAVRSDASQYYHYAWNIVHHGIFSSAAPDATEVLPDSFRDPGYPALLALCLGMTHNFSAFYALVLMLQATLGAATVTLLTMAGRRWLQRGSLALAAVLMAIWPHSVAIPAYVLTETLVGFLCAAALLATPWDGQARRRWVLTGFLWGLAGMCNAVLLPAGTVLAAGLWLWRRIDRNAALALALGSLCIPLAWGARSAMLPTGATSTSRAITNLVQGSWPTYHDAFQLASQGDIDGIHHLQGMQYEIDLLQKDPTAGLATMYSRMAERPMAHVAWYVWKPALLWAWDIRVGQGDIYVYPTRASPFFSTGPIWPLEATCYIANPLIMGLMAIGILTSLRRKDAPMLAVASSVLILFVTLVYTALQSEPRYSVPFRGVEMLLAAWGFTTVATSARRVRGTTKTTLR